MKRLSRLGVLAAFLITFSGCDTMSEMVTSNLPQSHTGRASIVVSLRAQEVYLYRGRHLAATSRISSGREGHRTPLGRFRVTRKDKDQLQPLRSLRG